MSAASGGRGAVRGGAARVAAAGAWAELLRVSALFTVPGDALAGAAASGLRLNSGTALAAGSSLCLYEAGMALNDYSDRHIDAVERPGRPLPSGRITPARALTASVALTAAGLGLAAAAGRRALLTATALAGTVWAYDLRLKHTALGPAAMAATRGLDLVLGATATAEAAEAAGRRARRTAPTAGAVAGVGKASVLPDGTLGYAPGRGSSRDPGTRRGATGVPSERHGAAAPGAASARVQPVGPGTCSPGLSPAGGGAWSWRSALRAAVRLHEASDTVPTAGALRGVDPPTVLPQGSGPCLPQVSPGGAAACATPPVRTGEVLRAAGLLSAHTFAVTTVSRRETLGASSAVPLAALGAVGVVASAAGGAFASGGPPWTAGARTAQATTAHRGTPDPGTLHPHLRPHPPHPRPARTPAASAWAPWLRAAPAAAYAATSGRPLAHALFNPSPPLLQRAVGGGIRATIPLQAALAVRAGRPGAAAAVLALLPGAVRLSRRVSPT